MTFAITGVGVELKTQVDVRAVTSSIDISYISVAIVGFVHVLDVGVIDYEVFFSFFWGGGVLRTKRIEGEKNQRKRLWARMNAW